MLREHVLKGNTRRSTLSAARRPFTSTKGPMYLDPGCPRSRVTSGLGKSSFHGNSTSAYCSFVLSRTLYFGWRSLIIRASSTSASTSERVSTYFTSRTLETSARVFLSSFAASWKYCLTRSRSRAALPT